MSLARDTTLFPEAHHGGSIDAMAHLEERTQYIPARVVLSLEAFTG